MLIPYKTIVQFLAERGITVRGVLHIGAHECEELDAYVENGVPRDAIDWIEANPVLVARMAERGVAVHNVAISDVEAELPFHITNNGQSSSLLELGMHRQFYPSIVVTETITVRTQRLANVIAEKQIPVENRNFWNLDIQGVELSALRSADDAIQHADAIYVEVNTHEVYKGCDKLPELDAFLASKGFKRELIAMTRACWGDALYVRVK